jgi:hypothetical protein
MEGRRTAGYLPNRTTELPLSHSILCLRGGGFLPLHIAWRIGPAMPKGDVCFGRWLMVLVVTLTVLSVLALRCDEWELLERA